MTVTSSPASERYPDALHTDLAGDDTSPPRTWAGHHYISPAGHPDFTEALLSLIRKDVAATSYRATARKLAMNDTMLHRWLKGNVGRRLMSADSVDAIVETYGLRAVVAEMQALRTPVLRPASGERLPSGRSDTNGILPARPGVATIPARGEGQDS